MAQSNGGAIPFSSSSEKQVKYRGVRKRKWGKWVSEIRLPNSRERIWLGSYDTPEMAARAFDAALFCLRGRNVKFNFVDSPPTDIAGGRSLTPAEIQTVAYEYANKYKEGQVQTIESNSNKRNVDVGETEEGTSTSSNCHNELQMDNMDWSFLEMLEPQGSNVTIDQDYNMISGLEDLHDNIFVPTNLGSRDDVDNNGDLINDYGDGGVGYFHRSFLRNL